jgi:hypothetical protein
MLVGEIMTSLAVTVHDDAAPQAATSSDLPPGRTIWRFPPPRGTAVD